MPIFALIEPVNVSRNASNMGRQSMDLEQNACFTLSNIILQLSNVSLRGGDIFHSLLGDISNLNEKYNGVKTRIETLDYELGKLDPESDHATEPAVRSDWCSDKTSRYQNVFLRETLPKGLKDQYNKCESPPPFKKLFGDILVNSQEESGSNQETNRMYTNPDYFQENWLEQKKQEKIKKRMRKNRLERQQNMDAEEAVTNDEKFQPVQMHREKTWISSSQKTMSPSQSPSQSPHVYANLSAIMGSRTGHTPHPTPDPFQHTEHHTRVSYYSTGQESFDDGFSIIYEVFDSEQNVTELDRDYAGTNKKFVWQCPDNDVMNRSFVETEKLKSLSEETNLTQTFDKEVDVSPLKKSDQLQKRESIVKLILKDMLLERRRLITLESSSASDDTDESNSESEESQTDSV